MPSNKLFYCKTPLQALIVNKIISEMPPENNIFVIYFQNNNSHLHLKYFDRINSCNKIFLPIDSIKFSDTICQLYNFFFILPKIYRSKVFTSIYFSSIGDTFLSLLLKRHSRASFNLFDDGTFNLDQTFFNEWINKDSFIQKAIRLIFSGEKSLDSYKKLNFHYTIFPLGLTDWIHCPSKSVNLFSEYSLKKPDSFSRDKTLRVLIGSFFTSDQAQLEVRYKNVVKKIKTDIHITHPGNKFEKFYIRDDLKSLFKNHSFTDLIAEEIIFILLQSGYKVNLYGFSSTVLFNLSLFTNSVSIALDDQTLEKKDFYTKVGIKLIKGF